MRFGKSFFKIIYKAHVYAGLFIAVHFAIFALTGLPLLFKNELQGESASEEIQKPLTPQEGAAAYDRAFQTLKQKYPDELPLALFPDDHDLNTLNARLGVNGATQLRGSKRAAFDLSTGNEIVEKPKVSSDIFDWTLRLHRELLLGSNGKIYIGLVGLVYVFLLISGFFIYGKFMKGRAFGDLRDGQIAKTIDLHKLTGMVSFGWGLIVGLSGVFLAFNGVLIKLFQYSSLKHLTEQYKNFQDTGVANAPIGRVVETAMSVKADNIVTYISYPNTEFGIPGHFLVLTNGTGTFSSRISELLVIDAKTAALTEIVELPLYLKTVLLSEPLHFGDYGGIFLKVLWALFTVCSLAVVAFGVASYFMKREKRQAAASPNAKSSLKVKRKPSKYPYAVPVVLAVISIAALFAALFAGGIFATLSAAVLLIPLIVAAFAIARRKNA